MRPYLAPLVFVSCVLSGCIGASAPSATAAPSSTDSPTTQVIPIASTCVVNPPAEPPDQRSAEASPKLDPVVVAATQAQLDIPTLGTTKAAFIAAHQDCKLEQGTPTGVESCALRGRLTQLPGDKQCEGGCTSWTYTFMSDRLVGIRISRSVFDADLTYYRTFRNDAYVLAAALTNKLGQPAFHDTGDPRGWAAIEEGGDEGGYDRHIVLRQITWRTDDANVTYWLGGVPGNHPGAVLNIDFQLGLSGPG